MKLSFHGAARTVTGSKHLLTTDSGKKILLDCGMFQGMGRQTLTLNKEWGFEPGEVDYVILSHAHIDHIGLLPKLVKDGFDGEVFCTTATADLGAILMRDSARIQESDVHHVNKRREEDGRPPVEPLYTEEDADAVIKKFRRSEYGQEVEVCEGVRLTFTDCGHLLGSSAVNLAVDREDGSMARLTFSGDVGRYNDLILRKPQSFPQADYVIMESTYGNKLHDLATSASDVFLKQIKHTCLEKGGKLLIPAFSVGRTQELLYILNRLSLEHRLPELKYYVDSPLSVHATAVIRRHPECFNKATMELLKKDDDVFSFPGAHFLDEAEDSMALVERDEPCVIIASSGMAEAGRIRHHILAGIEDEKNTVFIVGYCDPNSLGGQLRDGAREVYIFGKRHEVKAEVAVISSLSAHGDYDDLLQWLSCQDAAELKEIFLVHGEYPVQEDFRERLLRKGYENVYIPQLHETVTLK